MEKKLVVHCKRERFDVYVGRGSKWGNPEEMEREEDRARVIELYEQKHLLKSPELLAQVCELKDKVLGCYCAPKACHGDVLVRYANKPIVEIQGLIRVARAEQMGVMGHGPCYI